MLTRKDQSTHTLLTGTDITPAVCWERESNVLCLRLELPSGETHILSYAHFLAASFQPGKDAVETLRVSFSGHQIEIEGHGLMELLLTFQDLAAKWVRTAPERYRGAINEDSSMISNIRITDLGSEK